ncbi:MAG: hypothetical protein KGH72_04940 [Candidatus Micrarchaeota archaeon]|nr:hypothetical protein [Candidatus Micrarchaeota archaeon]
MAFPKHRGSAMPMGSRGLLMIAAIVIVILVIAYFALSGGLPTISSTTNVTISPYNSFSFQLSDAKTPFSIFVKSAGASASTLYMSSLPVLSGPIMVVTLSKGQTVNVSASGSNNADLQIKLIAANSTQGIFQLSYIPKILNVRPSSGIGYLTSSTGSGGAPSNTTVSTTTVSAGSTTTAHASTTTVAQDHSAAALATANASIYGGLMKNYSALFVKDRACTGTTYNVTFYASFHFNPTGPEDFENVSPTVITSITTKVTAISPNLYNVTYITSAPATTEPGLILNVNTNSNAIANATFTGLWKGFSFTTLNATYYEQEAISGNCGAYIPVPG